jgi:hypothetical protein
MAVLIGDWNGDGPASGATGALKRIREAWQALELAADPTLTVIPDLDWMKSPALGRMMQALTQGYHEELVANGSVGGVDSGSDTVSGTIL